MAMNTKQRTGLDASDPLFRQLVIGITYSKSLLITYYYVVFSTVFLFTLTNFLAKIRQRRAVGRGARHSKSLRGDQTSLAWSAQRLIQKHGKCATSKERPASNIARCSILHDPKTDQEQTPLLTVGSLADERNAFSCLKDQIASWLIYQPAPWISGRTMPSNATSSFILVYLLINLFYLFYNISFSEDALFILADRAGALFSSNLPILYMLSSKNQPLQALIGYSHASLNIMHRRLGEWMCLLAASHGGLMFVVWAVTLRQRDYPFERFIRDRVTVFGLCAMACYQVIFMTSLASVRHVAYELFLATHVFLQVGGLTSLYFHHSKSRPYVLASLGIWLLDRLLYRTVIRTRSFTATLKVFNDGETVALSMVVPMQRKKAIHKYLGIHTVNGGWQSLDHAFISIPSMGRTGFLQSHPFSVASPSPNSGQKLAELNFVVRAKTGFSRALLLYASRHKSVRVRVDGPYGTQSALRFLQTCKTRILVAGGSGIAVIWPLLCALLEEERQMVGDIEIGTVCKVRSPIVFVWIVRSAAQYYCIDHSRLAWLRGIADVFVILPTVTEAGDRPDVAGIVKNWITLGDAEQDTGVVCSGPSEMNRDVRNGCSEVVKQGNRVKVRIEHHSR